MLNESQGIVLKRDRQLLSDWFYSWSKEQCSKEFEDGFPLLRRIRASDVLRAIEIVESLAKPEGRRLVLLCIRRRHKEAADRANEAVTPEEELWFDRYRASHTIPSQEEIRIRGWNQLQEHFWLQMELLRLAHPALTGRPPSKNPEPLDVPPGLREQLMNAIQGQDLSKMFVRMADLPKQELQKKDKEIVEEMARFKIDRKALRTVVTNELSRSLGAKRKKESSREDLYEVPIGPWVVNTLVDFGSGQLGGFQMRYSQGIRLASGPELTFHPTLGLTSMEWLGPGVPHWNLLTNADLEEAAVVLSTLCTRFVSAVRTMSNP